MITDESIPLYALGALEDHERRDFESHLASSDFLQAATADLLNLAALLPLAFKAPNQPRPSPQLKAKILSRIGALPARGHSPLDAGVVLTDRNGLIQWVNPAFTHMCGHTLEELRGKKPGAVLHGRQTDPADVDFLRKAIRLKATCTRSIVNYHKDGTAYRVNINLTPLWDSQQRFHGYIAVEEMIEQIATA